MFVEPWNVFQGRSSQATLSTTVGYTRFEKKLIIWDNDANGLRICRHFVMPPLVCLKIKSEKKVQKFDTDDASPRRSGWCFWWVGEIFSFSRTNQKHHSDLKSDGSSIWNFCAHFSDIIIRWRRKMLAVFSSCEAKHRPKWKPMFSSRGLKKKAVSKICPLQVAMFLPGFSILGSVEPIQKWKGGH